MKPTSLEDLGVFLEQFEYPQAEKLTEEMLESTFVEHIDYENFLDSKQSGVLLASSGGGKTTYCRRLSLRLNGENQNSIRFSYERNIKPSNLVMIVTYSDFGKVYQRFFESGQIDHTLMILHGVALEIFSFVKSHRNLFNRLAKNNRIWLWVFMDRFSGANIEQDFPKPPIDSQAFVLFHNDASLSDCLSTVQGYLSKLGVTEIYFLFDNVDENVGNLQDTENQDFAKELLSPFLNDLSLINSPGRIWKLFLPSDLAKYVDASRANKKGVINCVAIEWDTSTLINLLKSRLSWNPKESNSTSTPLLLDQIVDNQLRHKLNTSTNGTQSSIEFHLASLALKHCNLGAPRALIRFTYRLLRIVLLNDDKSISTMHWETFNKSIYDELCTETLLNAPGSAPQTRFASDKEQVQDDTDEKVKVPVPLRTFVIQLLALNPEMPSVQVIQSPVGGQSPPEYLSLPYSQAQLPLLRKLLLQRAGNLPLDVFDDDTVLQFQSWGMVQNGRLLESVSKTIGQALHQSLFPEAADRLFFSACTQAKVNRHPLFVSLRFDAQSTGLADYPWELLTDSDERPLLANRVIELTRYIVHPDPVQPLTVKSPLRLLFMAPRPLDSPTLPPASEFTVISSMLQPLVEQGLITIDPLPTQTLEGLRTYLTHPANADLHLIHFDGHGSFGRLCPVCNVMYAATSQRCSKCEYPLTTVEPEGYLAFEDDNQHADFVSARVLTNTVARNRVQLMVLSACQSGELGNSQLASGTAPAMILAGIPAVVAMQLPIAVPSSVIFFTEFYRHVANFHSLIEAVGYGRQALFAARNKPIDWFVPVLYLRSEDGEGRLLRKE